MARSPTHLLWTAAGEPDPRKGAHGRFFATPHAVRRFRDRIRPHLSYDQARRQLLRIAATAHPVKERRDGNWLWRAAKPTRLRLVIGAGEGPLPAIVTVLDPHDGYQRGER